MSFPIAKKSGLFILACLMPVLLLSLAGCTSTPSIAEESTPDEMAAIENQVLQADAVLHVRLQAVQQADEAYAQVLTNPAPGAALDEKNGQIIQAEMALQQTLDSLRRLPAQRNDTTRMQQWLRFFEETLLNRRTVSDVRMVLSAYSDDSTTAHQMLLTLQNEVQEKNKRIAALERESSTRSNTTTRTEATTPDTQKADNAPAKGESVADLRQRNKNLSQALSSMQTKYFIMGRDYLVLKKAHERTLQELETLRNTGRQK